MTVVSDIAAVRGIETTTPAFRQAFVDMCGKLSLNPDYLAAVIAFESGFDPAAKNPLSDASGLIQFMPGTASKLGTTTANIRAMSAEEQVPLVERYMRELIGLSNISRVKTLTDTYMTVFAPAGIGHGDDYPLYKSPSRAYTDNKALDVNGDGVISSGEAASYPRAILAAADGKPRIPLDGSTPGTPAAGIGKAGAVLSLLVGAGLGYLGIRALRVKWPKLLKR
jgi:hypothetical protein